MARDYMYQHRSRILSEKNISNRTKIEAGSIVRFLYDGEIVHTKMPTVLVLNADWKGKLHGITINWIPAKVLDKLVKIVKIKLGERLNTLTKLRLYKLKVEIQDPENFYYKKIKPYIRINFKKGESPYRTFTLSGIKSPKILDYRFQEYVKTKKK